MEAGLGKCDLNRTEYKMDAFTKHEVVPNVIDQPPKEILQLLYGSTKIDPGMPMTPRNVKDTPSVAFSADPTAFYTLIMNDPDAPSRANPKAGEWHHWLVVNIPGGDVSKGEEKTQYFGSGPPKGTGLHRYVFLMFKQPGGKQAFPDLETIDNQTSAGRAKHNVRAFIKKYGMDSPDALVAGNFYQAEHDDYVPILMAQLKK